MDALSPSFGNCLSSCIALASSPTGAFVLKCFLTIQL
nr:MAG TPA: hypothetical protein [Caudoviricetes sp.]